MDGVLVDNMEFHRKAFAALVDRYGARVDLAAAFGMAGKSNAELFSEVFPPEVVSRVGVKRLGDEVEELYRELYRPELAPARGLIPLLDALKAAGVRLGIGTAGPRSNVDMVADGLGIRHYFDAIVNADMVSRGKPDPEIYLRALANLGVKASKTLIFEDSLMGIQAAGAAGVRTVAISTTLAPEKLRGLPGVVLVAKDFTGLDVPMLESLLSPSPHA